MNIKFFLSIFTIASFVNAGELTREIYKNLSGHGVHLIKSSANYPWNPSTLDTIPNFEFGPKIGDNYGARVLGYITVPEDGAYTFYLASDDRGELNISLDGTPSNLQKIASVSGWTGFRTWNKYTSQKSAVFNLTAGEVLYTEAFVKEGSGGDHLSVAWSKDGGPIEVISGDYLSPFTYDFAEQQELLSNAIQLAQSLYEQSASNIGTAQGEYSEASRVNFQQDINKAQTTLTNETTSGRVLAKAINDLDKATEKFTGGIKPTKILGVPFGTTPAFYSSRTFDKAHDGDINTFFDFLLKNGGHTGIEIPDGRETAVLAVRYHPRSGLLKRMVGGKFQGSVDGITYKTLHTITEIPSFEWQTVTIEDSNVYKFLRYVGPNNSHCNVAELEFLGLQNQELFMLNHETVSLKADTADQAIPSNSVKAEHGGLLPEFISFQILELPSKGILKLDDLVVSVDSTFTQKDINSKRLTFSSDSSRLNDTFKVKVVSSVGGTLPEVIISIKIDSDFDGLSDQQEIALGTDYDSADTNNNGISDSWEVENGLDPIADTLTPLVSEIQGENGLSASYNYGRFSKIADFASRSPAKVTKVSNINFTNSYWREFANSGAAHNVGAKFSGYLYIPIAGNYKFILSSDDGSKLYINGAQVINNDGLHSYTQKTAVVNLPAGFHPIRCEYFEAGGNHGCILQWEGPSRVRQVIPASYFFLSIPEHQALEASIDTDQDGLTDILEAIELTDPKNPDSDGDKLLDGEEYHAKYGYKTSPLNVDTDADTVSDYDEIFIFKSNPLIPDFDGSVLDQLVILPKNTSARLGKWVDDGDQVFASDRRGALEYTVEVTIPGIYKFDIEGAQNTNGTNRPYFDLHLYIDEEFVGRQENKILDGASGEFSFITPYLSVGTHKIKIFWDNVYRKTSLRVKSLQLTRPGGPDNNENGYPDWIDNYLNSTYSIDEHEKLSKISPAQIEGKGMYLHKIGGSFDDKIIRGTYGRWFSNISLKQGAPTDFTIDFEDGLKRVSSSITWEETNVLDEGEITIPIGSSMLLNAVVDGELDGSAVLNIDGEDFNVKPEAPLEYQFNKSGDFEVLATYSGSTSFTGILKVKVVEAVSVDAPYIWRGKERLWSWDGLSEGISLEATGMEFTPEGSGFRMKRSEVLSQVNIVARLGEDGPILKSLPTKGFWIRDAVEGFLTVVEKYEDGSIFTNNLAFGFQIPEGMDINVNTISGVTFLDGSRTKVITKDDFDDLHQWTLELLKSTNRNGASCHWYKVYQNGVFVGQQNK